MKDKHIITSSPEDGDTLGEHQKANEQNGPFAAKIYTGVHNLAMQDDLPSSATGPEYRCVNAFCVRTFSSRGELNDHMHDHWGI